MRTLAVALLAALAAVPAASAAPFEGGPSPEVVAESFQGTWQSPEGPYRIAWQSPERWAQRPTRAAGTTVVERGGMRWILGEGFAAAERRRFAVEPDGFTYTEGLSRHADFVLAQARAGKRTLASVSLGGRAAWRTSLFLHPNKCAGQPAGRATVWLSRETLLPLRVDERHGRVGTVERFTYTGIDAAPPAGTFDPGRVPADADRVDYGFRRATPAAADAHVSYEARLPTALPPGFELAVAGWAPRSGITGPEGSNPAMPELFGAVYRRGFERIDVSQRRAAGGRPWQNDPFGRECVFQFEEDASIGGVAARYGAGPGIVPHLYWRAGGLLYTVSGPFPKADLVAIAESLVAVS